MFERALWAYPDKFDTLRVAGEAVFFQNGFGAWARMSYTCDYSRLMGQVVAVNVFDAR